MTDQKYKISKLFQAVFGINSPVYISETMRKNKPPNFSYKGIETLPDYTYSDWESTNQTSWMGTPIIFPTTFMNNQKMLKYNSRGELVRVQLNDIQLPPATMFSFRRAKNIIKTNVLGSNGTVKEIYGFDDWLIDVRGLCLDEPNRSAKSQLDEMIQYYELASGVGVSGALFSACGISAVCMTDFNFEVVQGSNGGVISFTMQLTSDENIILTM
ncbi:DUF6046 domain-containing protein [Flavobacterium johnsoniae]|uniref:DUF6046 domain-containing protein n=1 Tax=Flavobacterium johnsoniae TaxID=986 RepID=A0A1M5IY87_FLAJO|nr:DUF6046 domain-containing protein [Flavobacterium johnsoniae]SHG33095.1 hypothetical protein SAMN05444388_102297 [Flavobacterium johnsoniae]